MRGSGNGDDFIREVDEAVRQDRWLKLWKQYGTYIVGAAVAIVAGSAAGVGWRAYQDSARADEARRYAAAEQLLAAEAPIEAAGAFEALAGDAGNYETLARLRAAAAYRDADDREAMVAALQMVADDGGAEPALRQLAALLMLQEEFDRIEPATLLTRLETFTGEEAAWRHSALELKALAEIRNGDPEGARATLDMLLTEPGTPPNLGRRAAELRASLGAPAAPAEEDDASEPTATDDGDPAGATQ